MTELDPLWLTDITEHSCQSLEFEYAIDLTRESARATLEALPLRARTGSRSGLRTKGWASSYGTRTDL